MFARVRRAAREVPNIGRIALHAGLLRAVPAGGLLRFAREARFVHMGPQWAPLFAAHRHPAKAAVVAYGASGDVRRMSWGQLNAAVNQCAHAFAARGLTRGGGVALLLPNSVEHVVAQLAIARVGATAVQIGTKLVASEIAYMLDTAAPTVIVVHETLWPTLHRGLAVATAVGKRVPHVMVVGRSANGEVVASAAHGEPMITEPRITASRVSWDDALANQPVRYAPVLPGTDAGGLIVFTSGTTGKPKGAKRKWDQTGLTAVAEFMVRCGMRSDDRHLVVCPLYHSAAPAFVVMMFALGATVVLVEQFDAEATLALIERERITSSFMVPTMLSRICELPAHVHARYAHASLRWVVSGAAPLPTATAQQVASRWGNVLWNFYGSTETGLVTLAHPEDHLARPGTVGRALPGNALRVLDTAGTPVPHGEIGELYAKNSTMIAEYHGNPEATAAAQRDGYFSVGDLARMDADGYVYLESRKHDMIISGGVNIYPREIEDCLHLHPLVIEAAIVGVADADWGERVVGCVVARDASLGAADLIAYCRAHLATYKIPRQIMFVEVLPRNATGKIDKVALRSLLANCEAGAATSGVAPL